MLMNTFVKGQRFVAKQLLCRHASHSYVHRQAKFLKKLMVGSNRSRKKFFTVEQPVSKSFTDLGSSVQSGPSGRPTKSNKSLRRVEVLNSLFMQQISNLMSTGEASQQLLGLGITLSYVKVSNDFSRVNVYWMATGTSKDELIEPILSQAARKLRHELTQLRVIGNVPPIEFHKDKTLSKITEVETLLAKCDFGEDFVPTSSKKLFNQTDTSIDQEEDLPSSEENQGIIKWETDLYNSVSMRQDMLGVKHDFIMSQIKELMHRVKNKKQNPSQLEDEQEQESNEFIVNVDNKSAQTTRQEVAEAKQRQNDFFKYLKKRQLERSMRLKRESTAAKDQDFYDQEAFERWKTKVFGKHSEELDFDEDDEDYYDQEEDIYSSNQEYRNM